MMKSVCGIVCSLSLTASAWGQDQQAGGGAWRLFWQSFDIFTVVLLAGSIAAVAVIIRCVMDIRTDRIMPQAVLGPLSAAIEQRRLGEAERIVRTDTSLPGRIVAAALRSRRIGRDSMREAAELAASEECAHWFRKIEPLNIIGHLGPLIGLAGTVWGMILAFTSLGRFGGQAEATELSLGISKALFHTLLGLCLAIPCLLVFGFYRLKVDRVCTRAMVIASGLVERIEPETDAAAHREHAP